MSEEQETRPGRRSSVDILFGDTPKKKVITVTSLSAVVGMAMGMLTAYWKLEAHYREMAQQEARNVIPALLEARIDRDCISPYEHAKALGDLKSDIQDLRGDIKALRANMEWMAKRR